MGLGLIQVKAHLRQHIFRLRIDGEQRTIGGKGQVITVPRVYDAAPLAPARHARIKIPHDQIGKRGRGGRTLRQGTVFAAKRGQQKAHLPGEVPGVKGGGVDLLKANAAEKVGDIQLQEIPLAHMGRSVAADSAALPIGGGLRCDRQIGEELPADLPLPATQRVVRHGQYAHIAVTLGDGDGVICCRRVPRIVKELLPAGREKRRQLPGVVQERQLRVKAVKIQHHIRRSLYAEFGHEVCVRRFKCDRILLDFHRGPPNIESAPCSTK